MSSSFANANNFVISNSTFTHVAGSQHNYNFSGRPSVEGIEAMTRFVVAVNGFKHTTENTSSGQQSEIHIHELGRSMDLPGGAQAHRPVSVQLDRPGFKNRREATHPLQPVIEYPHDVSPSGVSRHIANSPFETPQTPDEEPIYDPPSGLTSENVGHQEHEDLTDQPMYAENWSSSGGRTASSPSFEGEVGSRASNITSCTPAPPAPASLQPCFPPISVSSVRGSCRDVDSGAMSSWAQLPPLSNHHVRNQNGYGPLTLGTDPNFKPLPVGDVNGPGVSNGISQPFWFVKNELGPSPLRQQGRHSVSRHISHSSTPRHRAYQGHPPASSHAPNIDLQAQLYQESYNVNPHESRYLSYNYSGHSEFLPTQGYAPAYHRAPSAPFTNNHYAPAYGGVPPPTSRGGSHGVLDIPPFPPHSYYNVQ